MLCYAMLCYAMLCYVMLCYAMLCNVMLNYTLYRIINQSTNLSTVYYFTYTLYYQFSNSFN